MNKWKMRLKSKLMYWAVAVLAMGVLMLVGCQAKETEVAEVEEVTSEEKKEEPESYEYKGSAMENDKEESVYVLADASGMPSEINVSVALKNKGLEEKLTDQTFLTDLKNKEGDEEVTDLGDGRYEWENHGEDIRYEGVADPATRLPVSVQITYELDGKEVEPETLAGADGTITMHFSYKNQTGKGKKFTPFVVISGMLLDGDKISNLSVENGESKYVDGDYLVYGMMLPGVKKALSLDEMELLKDEDIDLPQELIVSFDATDFELDFTATMFSNGMLEGDSVDKITDRLDDLAEEFSDASEETDELKEKLEKLRDGGEALRNGADSLSSGLSQLELAVNQMAEADPQTYGALAAQVAQLAEGSETLSAGVSTYTSGVEKACDSIDESTATDEDEADYDTKAAEIRKLSDKIKSMKAADLLYDNFSGIEEGKSGGVSFMIETAEIKNE